MYEPEERPSSLSRILVPLGAIVVAAAIIGGAVFGLGLLDSDDSEEPPVVQASPTVAPSPTPPGANPAEVAIGNYVRGTLNATYGGDCSVASLNQQQPGPTGATGPGATGAPSNGGQTATLCSQHRGERENMIAYVLGQPLADPQYWIFLQDGGGNPAVTSALEITPDLANLPGIPWPFFPGAEVVVVGGDCLNVREGPALDQAAVDCIADGDTITLGSGPVDADGYQWWQVEGRAGWVVSEFLRYPDAR